MKKTLADSGYDPVLLSGSGSALFCMGPSSPASLLPHCTIMPATFYPLKK
jgi:hypothetical protein